MYLLKLHIRKHIRKGCLHLHSTMYLLKLPLSFRVKFSKIKFTFHYVSIKTNIAENNILQIFDLHSTMYLLKLLLLAVFLPQAVDLHSTMYLLKPTPDNSKDDSDKFTFHYVSIKTSTLYAAALLSLPHLHSTMYLLKPSPICFVVIVILIYIPLCIY